MIDLVADTPIREGTKEREVAELLLRGYTKSQIASVRSQKITTIGSQVMRVYLKCGVWSQPQLLAKAVALSNGMEWESYDESFYRDFQDRCG